MSAACCLFFYFLPERLDFVLDSAYSQHSIELHCSWLTNAHDLRFAWNFRQSSRLTRSLSPLPDPHDRNHSKSLHILQRCLLSAKITVSCSHNLQRCRLTRSPSPLPDPYDEDHSKSLAQSQAMLTCCENHRKSLAQSAAMQAYKVAVSTSRSPRRKSQKVACTISSDAYFLRKSQ